MRRNPSVRLFNLNRGEAARLRKACPTIRIQHISCPARDVMRTAKYIYRRFPSYQQGVIESGANKP
jgi:hypothetical protein